RVERFFGVGIVEGGEELALLDASALVEKHTGNAAGNFRSDGSAAARGDIAAGIEQGFATTGAGGLVHGGHLNDGLGLPKSENGARDATEYYKTTEKNSKTFA